MEPKWLSFSTNFHVVTLFEKAGIRRGIVNLTLHEKTLKLKTPKCIIEPSDSTSPILEAQHLPYRAVQYSTVLYRILYSTVQEGEKGHAGCETAP